jgi:hypothetical protein
VYSLQHATHTTSIEPHPSSLTHIRYGMVLYHHTVHPSRATVSWCHLFESETFKGIWNFTLAVYRSHASLNKTLERYLLPITYYSILLANSGNCGWHTIPYIPYLNREQYGLVRYRTIHTSTLKEKNTTQWIHCSLPLIRVWHNHAKSFYILENIIIASNRITSKNVFP